MNEPQLAVERLQTTLILDTNIWLDWLVFSDPAVNKLIAAQQAGQVNILAGSRARDELADVIGREQFGMNQAAQSACMEKFDALVRLVSATNQAHHTLLSNLQCTDPDDQQFLELAVATRADYLLSKDKALLKLARRARRDYRFQIMTLDAWNADCPVSKPYVN